VSIDPTAQAAYRVPRSDVDAFYVPGEQAPPSRAGVGTVVSVDSSNLCTVLVNDEDVAGVMWLGLVPPRVGDVVELELRGDLLVVPASNDLDTYLEGMDQTVEHIVSTGNPGTPPAEDLPVGGSMRSTDAWSFWGADTANWARELSASGQGMRLYQPAPPTLLARNIATNPSGEAGLGPNDAGYSWTAAETQSGTYSGTALVEATQEVSYSGSVSLKATWAPDPKPSSACLRVGGHTTGQYTAQVWVLVPTGSPDVRLIVQGISASAVTAVKDAWVQLTLTYTATTAEHVVGIATTAAAATTAGTVYFDALSIVAGATGLGAYFDGSTVDSSTDQYVWRGTPHLSASEHYSGATPPPLLLGTNLLTNPSLETNTTSWSGVRTALTRVTSATAVSGGYVAHLVNDGAANTHYLGTSTASRFAVTPGQVLTFSAYARLITGTGLGYNARVFFYDSAGALVGTSIGGPPGNLPSDGSWARLFVTATAPAGAASVGPTVTSKNEANTDVWEVDALLLQVTSTVGDYFDGSTATTDDAAYRWEGTAHASQSTKWNSPPAVPPGPAGILWSEVSFDVEPGDIVHFEMDLAELASDTTAQVYVLYGGVEGANPVPGATDTLQAAVGSVVALTAAISTLSANLTIPATVTLPVSGVVVPATVRLGVRLVGSGTSQVLATAARATHTPAGWPLGSQWMNPDAPEGGVVTIQEMPLGANTATLTNAGTTDNPIPFAKKAIVTAPKGTGGIAVVTFTGTFRIRTSTSTTYPTLWDGTKEIGLVYFASATVDAGWFPFVLRGTIDLAPGQEVTITPRYRYSGTTTTVPHELYRMQTMAEFYPGAVRSAVSSEAPSHYWDGDSWRPDKLQGAAVDLTQDATVAVPGKTNTTTTLARSASTLHEGTNLTLTATVTTGATGTVSFSQMNEATGIWTILGSGSLSSGKAVKTFAVPAGTYSFKAVYGGSPTHNPSTSATLAGTKVQKAVSKTVTLPCAWAQAYNEDGTKVTGTAQDTAVYQGQSFSLATNPGPHLVVGDVGGNRNSLLRFDHSGIPAAATITSVSLVCKSGGWAFWHSSSGGTLVVGSFVSQDTAPTTWPASKTTQDRSRHAVTLGGFTLNLSSWANAALEASTFNGIVIGPGVSTATQYYGYSTAPGKDQFTLKVTYDNWE